MSDEMKRPDAGENSPAEHERAAGRAAARLDRINRYADAALDKADDLEANLGLITAGLLETALAQQRLLDSATERFTDSPKELELQHRASKIICGSSSRSSGTSSWNFAHASPAAIHSARPANDEHRHVGAAEAKKRGFDTHTVGGGSSWRAVGDASHH